MKNILYLSFSILLFVCFNSEGQSIRSMLQTGKWYAIEKNVKTKKITYSHTASKGVTETVEFKDDSLMIRCSLKCDSTQAYYIKNDMLRIRLPKQNYEYFKYCFMGTYLQLTPIKPQEFE